MTMNPITAKEIPIPPPNTALPAHEILERMAAMMPPEIAGQWPELELTDIKAALNYAATTLARQQANHPAQELRPEPTSLDGQEPPELDLNKILVVDDIEENQVLIQYMFKGSGFTLSMASNAREAMAKARAELPVLIISDIQMPGMSGFELLQALKRDEQTKNIAVILVTAYQRNSKQVSEGLSMGADDYIYRPFMRDEFMSRVEAVVRVKRAEAEVRRHAQVVTRRNKGLELVNELALAVNSSLDFQEVFASSMQKLSQLLKAKAACLLLFNKEKQELTINISSRPGKLVSSTLDFKPAKGLSADQALQEQAPSLVQDFLKKHAWDLKIEFRPDTDIVHSIAMPHKEQVIGAIVIVNNHKDSFDEADWALLNSAAGIIAVAVENARLLESVQQKVDDLIGLHEIGRALTSTLELEQILKQTSLLVQRLLQAEAVALWMREETSQKLVLIASSGPGPDFTGSFHLPIYNSIADQVARTGELYLAGDVSPDQNGFEKTAGSNNYRPGSILCVPLQIKGQIIGVMQALHQNTNWFDHNHLHFSYLVASFVGIAVENARLFNEIQAFSRHLKQMVEERTQELAEEKEKIEAILTSMADGLLVLDAENRILTANTVAEGMLDFRLSQTVGKPISGDRLESPLWRTISDMVSSTEQTVNISVDLSESQTGAILSIQAHSARVWNEADEIIGTVIVLRDITALKELERVKARFVAGVTHELKTPLSIIGLHSKNLLNYYNRLPDEKRVELLNSIQIQVKMLEQLIENILQLSRLDAGISTARLQSVNLADLIEHMINELHPLAETKQINLIWQKPVQKISILADPDQIERVIRNLIDNAIKYTHAGGTVETQVLSEMVNGQKLVRFSVTDTGIGIPVEYQSRVFDRFYRVDPSHTIPGTGLGLAIVKEIVNAYGGEVELNSTPGAGSTFIVTLPDHPLK